MFYKFYKYSNIKKILCRVEATTLNGKSSKDFKSIRTESQVGLFLKQKKILINFNLIFQIEAILCQFAGNKETNTTRI